MLKIGDRVTLAQTYRTSVHRNSYRYTGTVTEIFKEEKFSKPLIRVDWNENNYGHGIFHEIDLIVTIDGNDILKDLCSK